MSEPIRDEMIRRAVELGLLPEDIGREFDDWSDGIAARVVAGTLSLEEATVLTNDRALDDAQRAAARGWPRGKAAEMVQAQREEGAKSDDPH